MTASPTIQQPNSRFGVYLFTALALLPAIGFWLFARVALWPRLEWLWTSTGFARYTGTTGGEAPLACSPDTLVSSVRALMLSTPAIFLVLLVVIAAAEFFIPRWRRLRMPALAALVLACTATVFLLFTVMCLSAIMAHPVTR